MTKLYISADIEGIGGVVSPEHCDPHLNPVQYNWAVSKMEAEVAWVIQASLKEGATAILVNDAHYTMTNLRLENLVLGLSPEDSAKVTLLSGKPKPVAMSAGLDESFDAAFFIGYHAKAGSQNGVLCHSFHTSLINILVNGQSLGEGGINAYYASLIHQVPVVLASGDDIFAKEITALLSDVEIVETKMGLGFSAANNYPERQIKAAYQKAITSAFSRQSKWTDSLLTLEKPYELQLQLVHPVCADTIMMIPGWDRVDGLTVKQAYNDFYQLYLGLQSAYSVLSYSKAYYS